jgi:hypothetical protein
MQKRNLYDIMQDPNIPADKKRMILDQLQQQAEPDSAMLPAAGAVLIDASVGTAGGAGVNRYARHLFDDVAKEGTLLGKVTTPQFLRHLLGNVMGGGAALAAVAAYDKYNKTHNYKDPLEGL